MRVPVLVLCLLASCSGSSGGEASSNPVLPPITSCAVSPSAAWKGTLALPFDPFVRTPSSQQLPEWVKFTVLECDPGALYFQDGNLYAFHYDFAVAELDPFAGMGRAEFDARTLYSSGRDAVLGAVLIPPRNSLIAGVEEYGVQLVSLDPLPAARVIELVTLVRGALGATPGAPVYYMPTLEQEATAEAGAAELAAAGIEVSSTARWASGDQVYAEGWALGRLKYVAAEQVEAAFLAGDLAPGDVLLTDAVGASLPLVAGTLTLAPATPSSHPAILAQTFGVPFAWISDPVERERVLGMDGRLVLVRAFSWFGRPTLDVVDVEDVLTPTEAAELVDLKQPPPLDLEAMARLGELARSADDLGLGDLRHVGGKAAGFGILRRAVPDNSPPALAFSFDLWNGFLDQPLAGGDPLRVALGTLLGGEAWPPVDMAGLAERLALARDWIRDEALTSFAPGHEAGVLAALSDPEHGLQPGARIRFRSSSNLEDAERFTGAGLYDSASGCLADELDGDADGPSLCDTTKAAERGVFRAIRRVFASFFDDAAFLSRRRHGVDELAVGMAVLAHHSFPDGLEQANGVATLERRGFGFDRLDLVLQAGPNSVTNPEPGEIAEVVEMYLSGAVISADIRQSSNLLPLGATVLEWEAEYHELAMLVRTAADRYAAETGAMEFRLEFEFKQLLPGGAAVPAGGLVLKQLRRLPQADASTPADLWFVGGTTTWRTFQGEAGDVFANHRLKSELTLTLRSGPLDQLLAGEGLVAGAHLVHHDGCEIREETFDLGDPAHAFQSWDGTGYRLALDQPGLATPRTLEAVLENIPTTVGQGQPPVILARDLPRFLLRATYEEPVMGWTGFPDFDLAPTTEQIAFLFPDGPPAAGGSEQVRQVVDGAVEIESRFFWPPGPGGVSAGYTAPLVGWKRTTITGLTSTPIVLEGEFSQTYRPEHHNFTESFLFQPSLEPGLDPTLVAELRAQGIDVIHVDGSPFAIGDEVKTWTLDELGEACATTAAEAGSE